MANMLYACSILYKTRLPLVVVFNKTDVRGAERCLAWMQDALLFQQAVAEEKVSSALKLASVAHCMPLFLRVISKMSWWQQAGAPAAVLEVLQRGVGNNWC